MFNINDVIVYGSHGVCKIEGIENKKLMGKITASTSQS